VGHCATGKLIATAREDTGPARSRFHQVDLYVAVDRALRFDLSGAFDRIGRDRLRALAAPEGQGRLLLDLGCDCALRPFWHGARMLVLDIADPPAAPAAPPAAPVLPFAPIIFRCWKLILWLNSSSSTATASSGLKVPLMRG